MVGRGKQTRETNRSPELPGEFREDSREKIEGPNPEKKEGGEGLLKGGAVQYQLYLED